MEEGHRGSLGFQIRVDAAIEVSDCQIDTLEQEIVEAGTGGYADHHGPPRCSAAGAV